MSYFYNGSKDDYGRSAKTGKIVVHIVLGAVISITLLMAILPVYGVWSQSQSGKAKLAEAEYSKRTKLEEAKTNLESERLNAQAEVERAKGAAEAIKIEGGSLTENYIRYLWVRQQGDLNDKTVISIPTEAGLPILEAGQR